MCTTQIWVFEKFFHNISPKYSLTVGLNYLSSCTQKCKNVNFKLSHRFILSSEMLTSTRYDEVLFVKNLKGMIRGKLPKNLPEK
ncbi:MAG: hypothetical protein CME64_00915 [Halobacteriovoraceae bacterium]|nr:hypothetical protein [Halobacteriovoraceae bacterium]